jgi:hypothetical protein
MMALVSMKGSEPPIAGYADNPDDWPGRRAAETGHSRLTVLTMQKTFVICIVVMTRWAPVE